MKLSVLGLAVRLPMNWLMRETASSSASRWPDAETLMHLHSTLPESPLLLETLISTPNSSCSLLLCSPFCRSKQ